LNLGRERVQALAAKGSASCSRFGCARPVAGRKIRRWSNDFSRSGRIYPLLRDAVETETVMPPKSERKALPGSGRLIQK
jgi:hypothetical protein